MDPNLYAKQPIPDEIKYGQGLTEQLSAETSPQTNAQPFINPQPLYQQPVQYGQQIPPTMNQQPFVQQNYSAPIQQQPYMQPQYAPPQNVDFQPMSVQVQINNPPVKIAKISNEEKSMHWRSFIFSLCFWITGIVTIVQSTGYQDNTVALIFFCIFGLAYYIECCCAGTSKYLSNDMKPMEVGKFLDAIMAARPTIVFHICCYHYETRYRTVSYTDANGNTQTRLESYQEKVITHTARETFLFSQSFDNTGVVAVEIRDMTRLHLFKTYNFVDQISQAAYSAQKLAFYSRNRRDLYQDETESFDIPGFESRLFVIPVGVPVPMCMNSSWYFFWCLVGLSWPFRLWFDAKTQGKQMTIVKSLKV